MALLERVSTLLRANLNDLIEKAEDPERMLKQIVLDMENQLMQVKTQVAIAIADEHLLEEEARRAHRAAAEWRHKAELARAERATTTWPARRWKRALSHDLLVTGFHYPGRDQSTRPTISARRCASWSKLGETRAHCEMLVAEHRRAKVVGRATEARQVVGIGQEHALGRMKTRVT